jgi:hypothetical protein
MYAAYREAKGAGGFLYRSPGGFWTKTPNGRLRDRTFGTPTVEALIARGLMVYDEWIEGRRGRFPVRAQVATKAASGGDTPDAIRHEKTPKDNRTLAPSQDTRGETA